MSVLSIDLCGSSAHCRRCGSGRATLNRFVCRRSNRNGNAGRPYLKCMSCNRFVKFEDERGIKPENPDCECGRPSRLQVAGASKGRKLHFVCSEGTCGFYALGLKDDGESVATLTDEMVERFAGIHI